MIDYSIEAQYSKWINVKNNSKFPIVDPIDNVELVGNVKILFSMGTLREVEKFEYTNIPLFLTESRNFIRRILNQDKFIIPWYVTFEPVCFGKIANKEVSIYLYETDYQSKSPICIESFDAIRILEKKIASDIQKYGSVSL